MLISDQAFGTGSARVRIAAGRCPQLRIRAGRDGELKRHQRPRKRITPGAPRPRMLLVRLHDLGLQYCRVLPSTPLSTTRPTISNCKGQTSQTGSGQSAESCTSALRRSWSALSLTSSVLNSHVWPRPCRFGRPLQDFVAQVNLNRVRSARTFHGREFSHDAGVP